MNELTSIFEAMVAAILPNVPYGIALSVMLTQAFKPYVERVELLSFIVSGVIIALYVLAALLEQEAAYKAFAGGLVELLNMLGLTSGAVLAVDGGGSLVWRGLKKTGAWSGKSKSQFK